jgi:hypothetical protein
MVEIKPASPSDSNIMWVEKYRPNTLDELLSQDKVISTGIFLKIIIIYSNYNNNDRNDANIQDASFLRLKILRLNYEIPASFLDKLSLQSASLYVSATNLLTFTKFQGVDPEAGGISILTGTSNKDLYPYSKTFSFGIKIGL